MGLTSRARSGGDPMPRLHLPSTLPVIPLDGPEAETQRSVAVRAARKRVLVVDDDEEMRNVLEESLRDEGYEVATAEDTVSGFIRLLGEGADVVVLDWKMPDLDGFELLASVRRCFPGLPVIFITAYARPEIHQRAVRGGAFGFLTKPFPLRELLQEVEGALYLAPLRRARSQDPTPSGR